MSKLIDKNKDIFGKYHFIIMPMLLALMSALGYGEYEKRQNPPAVTVNVESMPASMIEHSHRSNQDIQVMIDRAVNAKMKEHITPGKRH